MLDTFQLASFRINKFEDNEEHLYDSPKTLYIPESDTCSLDSSIDSGTDSDSE